MMFKPLPPTKTSTPLLLKEAQTVNRFLEKRRTTDKIVVKPWQEEWSGGIGIL
jgi:hypothetical protein